MATSKTTDTTNSSKTEELAGVAQVEERVAEQQDKGYRGFVPDETPNENYTVAGVLAGKPTPENEAGRKDGERDGK